MEPTLNPQVLAVLKILEQRMGEQPATFNQRFNAMDTPTFDDRFRTFEGDQAMVMPHEIGYGMSARPYDRQIVNDLFANGPGGGAAGVGSGPVVPKVKNPIEPPPLDPKEFPGMEDFLQPGNADQDMTEMMDMFMGG